MTRSPAFAFEETAQRVHDYRHLVARWRRVARAAKMRLRAFAQAGDYPVYYLQTAGDGRPALLISAGIHGDEPAGPAALVLWAEKHLARIAGSKAARPLLLFPCLNPWGLVNNQRGDAEGRDLNRLFDRNDCAPIRELKSLLGKQQLELGLNLHEDYDGRGIYLYEINRRPPDVGLELLQAASAALPIDSRRQIDGRPFQGGRALRRANLQRIPLHPEAIYLHLQHGAKALTFETPSEFSLAKRVQAHVLLIEECVRRLESET